MKKQLTCPVCKKSFYKDTGLFNRNTKKNMNTYCSKQCSYETLKTSQNQKCIVCGKEFYRILSEINSSKSGNTYCSRSCSATYNNTHKTKGYRRSKIEIYLEKQIKQYYPTLYLLPNDLTAINYELDLYFPDLKFAIELNGIFHYEPIYGDTKLERIKFNDKQKILLCFEKGIELCILDISKVSYFTKTRLENYWDIVRNILDKISSRFN